MVVSTKENTSIASQANFFLMLLYCLMVITVILAMQWSYRLETCVFFKKKNLLTMIYNSTIVYTPSQIPGLLSVRTR